MLRTFGSLTLVSCIACSVVSAAEAGRATREDPGERVRHVSRPVADAGAARMVMIEVLIADVRRGETAKGDARDLSGDPKTRIQQLDKAGKLDALTRVQLAAVENQKASLRIGQRVARITGSQRGPAGQVNSVTMENIGLMLGVTPEIRRDGLVVMAIAIERSQLRPAEEGTPTSKPSDGEAIRVPPTETLSAQTTISARNGQSVLVGAERTERQARQSELLIVVTPELINNEPPAAGEMTPHRPADRGR
jgi:Flp pilus assembly secretin CpaC